MADLDNTQFLVPARTYLYLAPKGTAAPVDVGVPATPWSSVGFTTADNVQFTTEPQFSDITSAQSDYPTGTLQTGDAARVNVTLQQWNRENLLAVYGGGTITESAGPPVVYTFTPPKLGARDELSAILRTVNGTKEYLWIFPTVSQREGVALDLNKTQEARLPLALAVLGADDADPWHLVSNDASLASA